MHVNIYFLSALAGVLALAWEALRTLRSNNDANIEDIVKHAVVVFKDEIVGPIDTRLTVMETKVDLVWRNITLNSVAVLHHPEPSRARVDYLLDCLASGTITTDEMEELRGYLEIIMKWEEGNAAPFKIFQGEQSAAAIVLSTMDHVITPEECHGLSDIPAGSAEEAGA